MALTATAQSALPREPTWDEAIVPALRKRLKDESTLLSKRISAASITSIEEQATQYFAARPSTSTSSYSQTKPSAIPRPSLQSSRTTDSSAGVHAGALPPQYQRTRALSQPYPFQPSKSADSSPHLDNARPISPINAPKGTRIPVSRGRTGSTSSQAQSTYNGSSGRANGSVGYSRINGEPQESHLWPVEEKSNAMSQTSRSTVRLPRHQVSDIFQEQAPFHSSTTVSRAPSDYYGYGQQTPERMSSDSEEHPFEHWYRGDVARNGGVGELRVARRQEMLDIANYGHTLRKASGKLASSAVSSRSRSNSRGRDGSRQRKRTRADSVGARESIYIDQDEMVVEAAVMDERPLTDLESDGYEDQLDDYYTQAIQPHPGGSISSPSLERSGTPTSRMTQNTTRSRIPQPTQRSRTTTPTPGKPTRSASETGMSGPSSSSPSAKGARSASQPKPPTQLQVPEGSSTPSTPTSKRRGKSPGPPSATKKGKIKLPPSSMKKSGRDDENRRSVGQYPAPEGDENAIPTWTQPVPANGNWDDVVLPVVARKKGLQDQYQTADGSPKPKEPERVVIEPAPGTFGFDATKYRKRYSENLQHIPMDEFGQKPASPVQELSVSTPEKRPSPVQTPVHSSREPSPPPFSRYDPRYAGDPHVQSNPPAERDQLQVIVLGPPEAEKQQVLNPHEEGDGAGCCKCVIM